VFANCVWEVSVENWTDAEKDQLLEEISK